ncbi:MULTISPECIES: S41 family peptidase [unclassified Pseudoalteromonas]|uniref:S41 family peptidase n=1 Tax=unclassified Pseudoalteromonas TaxID=194690 RepID=UPI0020985085|nr:S41 family peptidase [Pseudoalteromonas sp. XMcav2-N]MCO7188952.1 S41 family peptidase [Pseudoalteromonas sp. XMcav2-N]
MRLIQYFGLPLAMLSCISSANEALNKQEVVSTLVNEIENSYVETDKIPGLAKSLHQLQDKPAFHGAVTQDEFAALLSTELKKTDPHFGVQWRDPSGVVVQKKNESWFAKLARNNSGFNKVEILPGNVGYIDFWGFDNVTDESKRTVAGVMTFVANADALLVDLRKNGGGSGEMVQLISSYFLKPDTHLNSIYWRTTNTTREFYTIKEVAAKANLTIPLYVLTSKETFSAAEEFAYNLKHLSRATLVGEVTKGGANPWQYYELGNGFRASIPIAKAVNPITKSNWEGVGVKPDIVTTSETAFNTAYKLALKEVAKVVGNEYQLAQIKDKIDTL